jgi:hypothetical protein
MCNERDRLIAYIYDECDARERDAVRQHLDTCGECRTEVAGLRSVREDLLAWDVPAHESVWKPFTPAPPRVWWRQVPAWALAAAAGLVLIAGAAGGAAVQAFAPDRSQAQGPSAPTVQQNTRVSLTPADLDALERRLTASFGDRLGAVDAHVQQVSLGSVKTDDFKGDREALVGQIQALQEQNQRLVGVLNTIYANKELADKKAEFQNANLVRRVNELQTLVVSQLQPTSGK